MILHILNIYTSTIYLYIYISIYLYIYISIYLPLLSESWAASAEAVAASGAVLRISLQTAGCMIGCIECMTRVYDRVYDRVYGVGVWGLGFRVWGLGFRD